MVCANKEATEPRVSCGQIEVIIAKVLQSPSWFGKPLENITDYHDVRH